MLRQPLPVVTVLVVVMTVDDDCFLTATSSLVVVFSNSKTFFGARSKGRRVSLAPVTSHSSCRSLRSTAFSLLLPASLGDALLVLLLTALYVELCVEGRETEPLASSADTKAARTDSGRAVHVSKTEAGRLALAAMLVSELTRGGLVPSFISPVTSSLLTKKEGNANGESNLVDVCKQLPSGIATTTGKHRGAQSTVPLRHTHAEAGGTTRPVKQEHNSPNQHSVSPREAIPSMNGAVVQCVCFRQWRHSKTNERT